MVPVLSLARRVDKRNRKSDPMICNDKELAVVRKQLALAEHALEALRRDATNPRTFAVFSEGYVDQIDELKAEIDSYRPAAKKNHTANGKGAGKQKGPRK